MPGKYCIKDNSSKPLIHTIRCKVNGGMNLTSIRRNPLGPLKVLTAVVVILVVSAFFGQVMGRLYLGNLARFDYPVVIHKKYNYLKKVLRLKVFAYNTVEVAVFSDEARSRQVAGILAENGLPAAVTGNGPFTVNVGFVNDGSKLETLASSIQVDGQKARVVKGEVNTASFKFSPEDSFARDQVAPFLGRISTSLEKGLLLYSGVSVQDEDLSCYRGKFGILAGELEGLARGGDELAVLNEGSGISQSIAALSRCCRTWSEGLHKLEETWNDGQLLLTQQQALVLLEEYHSLLESTN